VGRFLFFDLGDLGDAPGVASALEIGGQPQRHDLLGQALAHNAGAYRQHIGVVVLTTHPGRVQVVAQRGSHAPDLVRGELLTLTRAAEHDPAVGFAIADPPSDASADERVVARLGGIGSEVDDLVPEAEHKTDQVLLEDVSGVVRTDGDAHPSNLGATRGGTGDELVAVDGYDAATYGDSIADVYDEWYADVSDIDATIAAVATLAGDRPVLELGIGSGRLAVPLREAGVDVWGVDASTRMVELLRRRDPLLADRTVLADMSTFVSPRDWPASFGVAFIAFNTLCNLPSADLQRSCLQAIHRVLRADGTLAVECFVPAVGAAQKRLDLRSIAIDRVVLTASIDSPSDQTIVGQHIELSNGGVKLRPFHLRYISPAQLDDMAVACGFTLVSRAETWDGEPFTADSPVHVSLYRPAGGKSGQQ
jgi:SAM-dependent methyltransferase